MVQIDNAFITGTSLGFEDHGILTARVFVEFDSGGCAFGGYAMDNYDAIAKRRTGTAFGCQFVMDVIQTIGVEKWEDLKGKHCRVEHEGLGGRILRIGHFMKNQWFDPKVLADRFKEDGHGVR